MWTLPKKKQKFQLSKKLRMGVDAPSSQGTVFKVGGVFFLVLSLLVCVNIYRSVSASHKEAQKNPTEAGQQEVLGAFDENKPAEAGQTTAGKANSQTYTVQKGDTLFNIAQNQGVNWAVIATLNNLKAPYSLKPGMVLKLEPTQ